MSTPQVAIAFSGAPAMPGSQDYGAEAAPVAITHAGRLTMSEGFIDPTVLAPAGATIIALGLTLGCIVSLMRAVVRPRRMSKA